MPFEIRKVKKPNGYKVFKKDTEESFSEKPFKTKKEALKQLQAININYGGGPGCSKLKEEEDKFSDIANVRKKVKEEKDKKAKEEREEKEKIKKEREKHAEEEREAYKKYKAKEDTDRAKEQINKEKKQIAKIREVYDKKKEADEAGNYEKAQELKKKIKELNKEKNNDGQIPREEDFGDVSDEEEARRNVAEMVEYGKKNPLHVPKRTGQGFKHGAKVAHHFKKNITNLHEYDINDLLKKIINKMQNEE